MRGVILWDFDGTLGDRPGGWTQLLIETLDAEVPDHDCRSEMIRPYLASGFPWHTWEHPHPELSIPDAWWSRLCAVFQIAYEGVGFAPADATRLAGVARTRYVNPAGFRIYRDSVPALQLLSDAGWRHAILSNHVPELAEIVRDLGLKDLVEWVISSATTGFEKPHPEAYSCARELVNQPVVWMVGDNPEAGVAGARRAGLRSILVRNDDQVTRPYAPDLMRAAEIILR